MAYKVNYNFQKAERDRAKAAKKEAKAREKQQQGRAGAEGESGEPTEGNGEADPVVQSAVQD